MDTEKFVGRVEVMLFETCGCNAIQAEIILKECLKRLRKGYRYKRDKSRMEQVEMWANFVKTHPREEWEKYLKQFIDRRIEAENDFFKELAKTKEGRAKIRLMKMI